jgi:enterochelin esterase-like enzyme
MNANIDRLRLYVGNALDPNHNAALETMTALTDVGIDFEFDGVYPKTGGVWDTWRVNLRDFAGRLFQDNVADHGMSQGNHELTEEYVPPAEGTITTPHIDQNGMVTFETGTQWSEAKDVVLWGDWAPNGQWFRIPLTKVGDRWRGTIGPIDGYYYWRYEVNGTGQKDPQDTLNTETVESQLFVPGGVRTPLLADVADEDRGQVSVLTYGTANAKLKVWVPADYDPDRAEEYPVMYLYHGMGQNYASWTEVGRAAQILDNLYLRGELAPMVVVMPGYSGTPNNIWTELNGTVIPFIDANFNVSTDRTKMALAGLSWGGYLTIGTMVNQRAFAYYGIFSPPFASASFNGTSGPIGKANTKLVSLMAGDVDTGAVSAINNVENNLKTYGIPVVKQIIPGPHGFDVWWAGLADFAPRLFKPEVSATVSLRCVVGKAQVVVSVANADPVARDVTVETPYGSKILTGVAAGQAKSQAFATKLGDVPAGSVQLNAGGFDLAATPYPAKTCG